MENPKQIIEIDGKEWEIVHVIKGFEDGNILAALSHRNVLGDVVENLIVYGRSDQYDEKKNTD